MNALPAFAVDTSAVTAPVVTAQDVSVWFGETQVLRNISMEIPEHQVTALIGPSGCGKSTFLHALNRMNERVEGARTQGIIRLWGLDIHGPDVDPTALRRRVGLVFQKSNPFPKSIHDNVAFGPRLQGTRKRSELEAVVEMSLRQAALWDDVKDRLAMSALQLSGGEQQRLCLARALAARPEVLLLDEPAGALDPTATARIEELILELKTRYTIIIATHNMQQANRISDFTAFLHRGELIEHGPSRQLFSSPAKRQTEDYVTGRFG